MTKYPMLTKVFANAGRAFSDFEGPTFEGADIELDFKTSPEGKSIPQPETARIKLPDLEASKAKGLKDNFTLTLSKSFEDETAIEYRYSFTFRVWDFKFKDLGNGMVQPSYEQKLETFDHA